MQSGAGDGFRLAQSLAIANYLAAANGLGGKDARETALIEQALGGVEDARMEARKLFVATPEQRKAIREELADTSLPRWFGHFEKLLQANRSGSEYLVGNSLSVADLALWYLLEMIRDNGLGARLADHPVLSAFFERIAARPRIAAYLSSARRPALMLLPA